MTLDVAVRREFDYLVPAELEPSVHEGTRVKVPFGPREVMGVVTAVLDESPHGNLREIIKTVGGQALVTPPILRLVRWIADYYCCAPEIAMKAVLPDAVRKEEEGWRERLYVRALPQHGELPKLTKRQEDLWTIVEEWRELPLQELVRLAGTTSATIRKLEDKGLVSIAPQISERDPYAKEHILPTQPLELNAQQATALESIVESMERLAKREDDEAKSVGDNVFLLHGVTGSGKTEVYLQAIAHALGQGKGAIVLVPEISLTPQTVERFKARFSQGPQQTLVAVLHSHLSAGERHDEWHKIRQGRARIVIGARSAVFAPVEPLGLVIVDEEHEHSYKQEEAPRYNARDLAVVRGQQEGAAVVLGSATPCMESYHNVQLKKYGLLSLPERVDNIQMPLVRVIDMRSAARSEKGISIFSPQLREAILQRLEKNEQVMLFLNRRGWSSSLQCPECGFVAECPNCSVSLTYHRAAQQLMCHICGHVESAPKKCPETNCGNAAIRFSGLGTEKVEAALEKGFPSARVKRMDSDTLKRKEDYRRILGDFRTGKIDILVGTQMIAKGLHFPNVTLVGIIHADLSLHIPDFRAGERTFQLLTQVAGRAGRGDVEGEVYVQSFTPFHPAIQYARRHDFTGFFEQEIEFRRELRYPPVSRVALLTLRGRSEDRVKFFADNLRKEMDALAGELGGTIVAGPAPAPLLRAESFYRYQVMIRTGNMAALSRKLSAKAKALKTPDDIRLVIDIDPLTLS
ncbi:MAG: primosomal protein N' [Verrucomicrobiota bacterium]|nr:primosomal protein N' [Verrucomicrobiota bacterium]MDP6753698.1 primosomal protein N' [Verrucomicrobiota bacterium]MDP7013102.1 primosomal protein N' [Verrucomicrobiota bacterium]